MENEKIVALIQGGKHEYLEQLYLQNRRMIYKVIRKCGISLSAEGEDALQDGYIGLHTAALNFNNQLGVSFSTFAYRLIFNSVLKGRHIGRSVYMPEHVYCKLYTIQRVRKQLRSKLDREPTEVEVSESCGISVEDISTILHAAANIKSLNTPTETKDGTAAEFGELLPDKSVSISHQAEQEELKRLIHTIVNALPEAERAVIIRRYKHNETQETAARRLNVSCDEVRQAENRAITKLRHYKNKALFENYI